MALSALGGYFDESERKDGSEPISVAGYVFKPKSYEHFSRKRARMLASAGSAPTPYFHMTELYARDSDDIYAGWSVEQRAEVLRQAVDAVRKHTYCGVSVLLSQSEFEAVAPPLWRFEYGHLCRFVPVSVENDRLWDGSAQLLPAHRVRV